MDSLENKDAPQLPEVVLGFDENAPLPRRKHPLKDLELPFDQLQINKYFDVDISRFLPASATRTYLMKKKPTGRKRFISELLYGEEKTIVRIWRTEDAV